MDYYKNCIDWCIKDHDVALKGSNIGWIKRNGFDLTIKLIIVLFNSIGRRNNKDKCYVFVDEVKNSNMSNNLRNTSNNFSKNGENTQSIQMYSIHRNNHLRAGFVLPILLGILTVIITIPLIVISVLYKGLLRYNMIYLAWAFKVYLLLFKKDRYVFILMTDHHFYSTLISYLCEAKTIVLQHGLMYNPAFFEPRAGYIFVWGKRSLEQIKNKKKAVITGTYKFDGFSTEKQANDTIKRVLFCVNSIDNKIVEKKIETIYSAIERLQLQLIVKCHPGSLYSTKNWIRVFKDTPIIFEKEKLIEDIEFDFAIMEDSTAILDVMILNKPFILFDSRNSYFSYYDSIIPRVSNCDEIVQVIQKSKIDKYHEINQVLIDNELNGNECSIRQSAINIMREIYTK